MKSNSTFSSSQNINFKVINFSPAWVVDHVKDAPSFNFELIEDTTPKFEPAREEL